jgi:hypothetical protein
MRQNQRIILLQMFAFLQLVPTANPKRLTATANRLILAPDERSLQVDLVRLDRTVPVAGPRANTPQGVWANTMWCSFPSVVGWRTEAATKPLCGVPADHREMLNRALRIDDIGRCRLSKIFY